MSDGTTLRALFDHVVALAANERESYLDSCDASPDVVRQVREMLATDERLGPIGDLEASARHHPWPGDLVGAYRLIAPIGTGGMATVWRAASLSSPDIEVAVKFPDWTNLDREEAVSRVRHEAAILAALAHPAVVTLVDAGETDSGLPFLILRELRGRPLDQHWSHASRTADEAHGLIGRIIAAVATLHEHGVIHRDLKPSNIMVTDDGWPVLIDFGIACLANDVDTRQDASTPHTPAFASPEQTRGEDVDYTTDVFALGRIMGDLLTSVTDPGSPVATSLRALARRASDERAAERHPDGRALLAAWRDMSSAAPAPQDRAGTRLVLISCVVLLAVLGALFALRPRSSAVSEDMLEAIEAMPPREIPGEAEELAELAQRRSSLAFATAALVRYEEDGQCAAVMSMLDDVSLEEYEGNDLQVLELARVQSDFGLIADAQETLEGVDERLLEPDDRLRWLLVQGRCRARAGWSVDADEVEAWELVDEGVFEDEELEHSDAMDECFMYRISRGDVDAMREWLDEADEDALEPPHELEVAELASLIELHRLLVARGISAPCDEETLEQLHATLDRLCVDDPAAAAFRARGMVHVMQVHALGREDAEAAHHLAAEMRAAFDDEGMPADLCLELLALEHWYADRAGLDANWELVEDEADDLLGDAPLTQTLADHDLDDAMDPFTAHQRRHGATAGDELSETLHRAFDGDETPWWFQPLPRP